MKISLGTWAFSFGPYADAPVPFETIVKRLSEAGYDGIEISGFPPHVTLAGYPTAESRRELRRFLSGHNLEVSGYAADFTSVNPVTAGNERRYLDLFERNLAMCVDIGSPNIRVDTVAAPGSIGESEYDASFERLAGVWREAAALARRAGVKMVWEFEPGFAFNKPSEIAGLHQLVNHASFRVMFDTAHAYMCGVAGARQHGQPETVAGVKQFFTMLEGRVGAIHLMDSDGTLCGDETSTHCPFGEGVVDFASLAPRFLAQPDIEWWCVDMCFWPGSWDLIESSLRFARSLAAR
jgi:sugar phosphate isomerase/epimerase